MPFKNVDMLRSGLIEMNSWLGMGASKGLETPIAEGEGEEGPGAEYSLSATTNTGTTQLNTTTAISIAEVTYVGS